MFQVFGSVYVMVLGSLAFIYFFMSMLGKPLEAKIDYPLAEKLDAVVREQAEQRKRTDQLYQIVMDMLKGQNPRTDP